MTKIYRSPSKIQFITELASFNQLFEAQTPYKVFGSNLSCTSNLRENIKAFEKKLGQSSRSTVNCNYKSASSISDKICNRA